MAAPSKSWTAIADSKIDADSPVIEELKTFERDNGVHSDERIGIPVAPGNRQANHRHLGLDVDGSAVIELTPQENLIEGGDQAAASPAGTWILGSAASSGDIAFFREAGGEEFRIRRSSGGAADDVSIRKAFISANLIKKIKSASGKGRFTCSMHIKRVAAASGVVGGTLRFGLHGGASWVTGAFVDIDFDDVTQEYKRFFLISDQITRPAALILRAEWTASPSDWDTISNGDDVAHHGGYAVTNGAGLAKWDISHLDGGGDSYDADANNLFYWWDEIITVVQETV